jgi:hypothetical protein
MGRGFGPCRTRSTLQIAGFSSPMRDRCRTGERVAHRGSSYANARCRPWRLERARSLTQLRFRRLHEPRSCELPPPRKCQSRFRSSTWRSSGYAKCARPAAQTSLPLRARATPASRPSDGARARDRVNRSQPRVVERILPCPRRRDHSVQIPWGSLFRCLGDAARRRRGRR